MSAGDPLVRILADGEPHSGAALAAALGITRSGVWKQVQRLAGLGLNIEAQAGRGYRLATPLELLDGDAILTALSSQARASCAGIEIVSVTGSTSADLLAAPTPVAGTWRARLAEYQALGRGRRGRLWHSPYGSGLCLSLAWVYASAPRDLPALSLALGVGAHRALEAAGARGVALKWPNDVVLGGAKLAGILVDVDGDSRGPLRVVAGIGLNLAVPPALAGAVAAEGGLAPAGLDAALAGRPVARNALAAGLLGAWVEVLQSFAGAGFVAFADGWRRQDFLFGRAVTITGPDGTRAGVARGIAADGALLIESRDGLASVYAGDVTVREVA
ncbi:MAG: biotin--[acetyl-CoA-carboxylase] ligase [Gammaproteobacteria bacterium]|nr:biotin--[acetyl-CoA-carboxylase] ligase [Gammaproteobacteria bacterium]